MGKAANQMGLFPPARAEIPMRTGASHIIPELVPIGAKIPSLTRVGNTNFPGAESAIQPCVVASNAGAHVEQGGSEGAEDSFRAHWFEAVREGVF